ncbi:MAG: hypothetical protein ACLP7Q_00995 [Isosphaeraceae bacterium]
MAKALAESRGSDKRNPLVAGTVIGASVLLGCCLLFVFAPRKEPVAQQDGATRKTPLEHDEKVSSTPGTSVWESAIEEAFRPGNVPMSQGLGTEDWMTGQVLPAKADAKSLDHAGWGVLKVYQPFGRKQEIYVRLHKKESLDVLRMITKAVLLHASPHHDITYIDFYTPWALGELKRVPGERPDLDMLRSWAYGKLVLKPKPKLDVTIQGLTVESEAILTAVRLPPGTKVIGSWLDDERQGRLTIYRDSTDRLYLEELYSDGKKVGDDHELIELPSSDGRRFEDKSPESDRSIGYYLIEEEGDLQTRFTNGTVWKARAIR